VGLVASPGTEGFNDFLGGLRGSGLAFDVTVAPTPVQGKDAPARVASAIAKLQTEPVDIIVVVRGGGSKADLAAFDHEAVARAIATSDQPVWTGIGHTGDRSVADEVANRCCITPTECGRELAGLALDYWRNVREAGAVAGRVARERLLAADRRLAAHQRAMATGARIQLDRHREGLGHRARNLRTVARGQVETHAARLTVVTSATTRAATRAERGARDDLVARSRRLAGLPAQRLELEELRSAQRRRLLDAYDYQRQLERGYSVTRDASGAVVRSIDGFAPGTALATQLSDGTVDSTVTGTRSANPPHTTKGSD
jgi:exodeoxyribonuclease VII large subunit